MMEEIKLGSSNDGNEKKKKTKKLLLLVFRWGVLLYLSMDFFLVCKYDGERTRFFGILTVAIIYNFFVSLYISKQQFKSKGMSRFVNYIDIVVLCLFLFPLGGINSDIFILLFFIIGYCGIYSDLSYTIKIGLMCVAFYSIACVYSWDKSTGDFNYWRLIMKDFTLVFASFGITRINSEVKRYGDMHKKEFKLARTDKLTGLANRHYFDQKLGEEVEYADYSGNPLNILIFDLDNFKKFNDTYGHLWGDKLLMLFSDIIKQNIRKSDIPVRYGGEEFLIIIRDLDSFAAKSVADRIRRQLEKQRIYVGNDENRKRVTVSCGVAQYPKNSADIKQAIELADKALYHAKETGKNIVVCYDEVKDQL